METEKRKFKYLVIGDRDFPVNGDTTDAMLISVAEALKKITNARVDIKEVINV